MASSNRYNKTSAWSHRNQTPEPMTDQPPSVSLNRNTRSVSRIEKLAVLVQKNLADVEQAVVLSSHEIPPMLAYTPQWASGFNETRACGWLKNLPTSWARVNQQVTFEIRVDPRQGKPLTSEDGVKAKGITRLSFSVEQVVNRLVVDSSLPPWLHAALEDRDTLLSLLVDEIKARCPENLDRKVEHPVNENGEPTEPWISVEARLEDGHVIPLGPTHLVVSLPVKRSKDTSQPATTNTNSRNRRRGDEDDTDEFGEDTGRVFLGDNTDRPSETLVYRLPPHLNSPRLRPLYYLFWVDWLSDGVDVFGIENEKAKRTLSCPNPVAYMMTAFPEFFGAEDGFCLCDNDEKLGKGTVEVETEEEAKDVWWSALLKLGSVYPIEKHKIPVARGSTFVVESNFQGGLIVLQFKAWVCPQFAVSGLCSFV